MGSQGSAMRQVEGVKMLPYPDRAIPSSTSNILLRARTAIILGDLEGLVSAIAPLVPEGKREEFQLWSACWQLTLGGTRSLEQRDQILLELLDWCQIDLTDHQCELIVLFATVIPSVIRNQTRGGSTQFWYCPISNAWCIMSDEPLSIGGCQEYQIEYHRKYMSTNTIRFDPISSKFYQAIDYLRSSRWSTLDHTTDPKRMNLSETMISIAINEHSFLARSPAFIAPYFEGQPRPKK